MELRFQKLRAHPAFEQALRARVSTSETVPPPSSPWPTLALAAFVIVLGLLSSAGALELTHPARHVFGLGLLLMGLLTIRRALRRRTRKTMPEVPLPAVVLDKWIQEVETGRDNGKKRKEPRVALRDENGGRSEYKLSAELFERLLVDEIGVAFVRGCQLLDYQRVSLPEKELDI